MVGTVETITSESWTRFCAVDPCAFVLVKQKPIKGVIGVHVDDFFGGGHEVFDRTILGVKREFDFGAWDGGAMRVKERQLTQMANYEIMMHMEHCMHGLLQIEVSKSDKAKSERSLSAKEMTRYRGGLGSIGWLVDHCSPLLSFDLSERHRRQKDYDLLNSIDCKLKIRSSPGNHLGFMGVHDAAHANVEGGASQQAHVILAVHKNVTATKSQYQS